MPLSEAYRATQETAGFIDRGDRVRLLIKGPDRAKFLHNLVTNDVKRLPAGRGLEAFVTSPQGKTMAYVTLVALETQILLRTDLEALEGMLPHLRKYGVFDDVEIEDLSASTFEIHLAGPRAEEILTTLGLPIPPPGDLTIAEGSTLRVVRESPTGRPGLTLIGPLESLASLRDGLIENQAIEANASTFESMRIEAGTPVFGQDVTIANLPQEVGRDARTINFVKGCYLGQETVARLDALGHVNRILKGARVEGSVVPPAGSAISFEGKPVGSVTSSSFSEGWDSPVFLAYLKVAQAVAGTRMTVATEAGEASAIVQDLPMLPEAG